MSLDEALAETYEFDNWLPVFRVGDSLAEKRRKLEANYFKPQIVRFIDECVAEGFIYPHLRDAAIEKFVRLAQPSIDACFAQLCRAGLN